MLISCPICTDQFIPSASMACTPCGHVFHVECVLQWFERSKTCPQCRKPATDKKLVKIFLNQSEDSGSQEDPSQLTQKISDLNLKLQTQKKNLNQSKAENETLSQALAVSKVQNKTLSDGKASLESQVSALRKHLKAQRTLEEDLKLLRDQKERLECELKTLKSLDVVLHGSVSEAEEAMLQNCDGSQTSRALVTMSSALKRKLTSMEEKLTACRRTTTREVEAVRRQMAANQLELQQHHEKEVESFKSQLAAMEAENNSLRKKMKKVQDSLVTPNPKSAKDKALTRLLQESPMPEEYRSNEKSGSDSPEIITISSPDCENTVRAKSLFPVATKLNTVSAARPRLPLGNKQSTTGAVKKSFSSKHTLSSNIAGIKPKLGDIGKAGPSSSMQTFSKSTSSLFGPTRVSRMASNDSLNKRLYDASQAPPDGMVYNGLGGTVKEDYQIKPKKKYFPTS